MRDLVETYLNGLNGYEGQMPDRGCSMSKRAQVYREVNHDDCHVLGQLS